MRFLRHDGSDRSDVSLVLVNPAQMSPPVGRPRCQAIARDGRSTPFPSSAMSPGWLFLNGLLASIARLRFAGILRIILWRFAVQETIIERQAVS